MNSLQDKLTDDPRERVGFILRSGEIVEVENICPQPTEGFEVRGEDLLRYHDEVVATWHTHPGKDSCLSASDYHGFRNYPYWDHYIIGVDGIQKYVVRSGRVQRES